MSENQPNPWDAVLGGNNPPASNSKFPNEQQRVPVLNPDGTSTTSTKVSRARHWLETGKAKAVIDDRGVFSVQLVEPSSRNHQSTKAVQVNKNNQNLLEKNTEDTNLAGCTTLIKWIFWFLLAAGSVNTLDKSFAESITGLCGFAWLLGLLNPSLVVRFGLPKSRWTVTLIYLTAAFIFAAISSPQS